MTGVTPHFLVTSYKLILYLTTAVLIWFESVAINAYDTFVWDFVFLEALLIGVYLIRKKIRLHPLHYTLFAIFLMIHNLGIFNFYSDHFLTVGFDSYVSLYFGFVAGLIVHRACKGKSKDEIKYLAVLSIVLGLAAFHEIFEFVIRNILPDNSMAVLIEKTDFEKWDTEKDLLNVLIGAFIAVSGVVASELSLLEAPQKKTATMSPKKKKI